MKNKLLKEDLINPNELGNEYFHFWECPSCKDHYKELDPGYDKPIIITTLRGSMADDLAKGGSCPICFGRSLWSRA